MYAGNATGAFDASKTMSIVHLQNVEIINSQARFSGMYIPSSHV